MIKKHVRSSCSCSARFATIDPAPDETVKHHQPIDLSSLIFVSAMYPNDIIAHNGGLKFFILGVSASLVLLTTALCHQPVALNLFSHTFLNVLRDEVLTASFAYTFMPFIYLY